MAGSIRGQSSDKLYVALEKIVLRQLLAALPHHLFEFQIHGLAGELGYAIEAQADQPVVVNLAPAKFLADVRVDVELFAQLAGERFARLLAGLDFSARKFPFQRVPPFFPLADQHQTIPFDHGRDDVHSGIIEARMHSERLLDHFRNPRNTGELPPPALKVDVSNPACGDMLRLFARFENDRVAEARFQTRGCTASIAAASALTEWMIGKSRAELKGLTAAVIEAAVGGLEPASKHAAVLCVDGVKRLLA
jgi:nitrogen fixation NifU-like protein